MNEARNANKSEAALRDYSLWDTLKDLRFSWPWFFAATPRTARRERARSRAEAFNRAAERQTGLDQLADDLAKRKALWERNFDSSEPAESGTTGGNGSAGWGTWLPDFLIFGADEIAWLAVLAGLTALLASVVVVVAVAVPWFIWHIVRARRRAACRLAMERGYCPDCGYDLRGVPEPIDPVKLRGQSAGPSRCPECSSPWPLVPPPVRGAR
jgi:predicted Zn-ribbon and HTH transcriptional regulator